MSSILSAIKQRSRYISLFFNILVTHVQFKDISTFLPFALLLSVNANFEGVKHSKLF